MAINITWGQHGILGRGSVNRGKGCEIGKTAACPNAPLTIRRLRVVPPGKPWKQCPELTATGAGHPCDNVEPTGNSVDFAASGHNLLAVRCCVTQTAAIKSCRTAASLAAAPPG